MTLLDAFPDTWERRSLSECVDILDKRRIPVNAKQRALRKGDVPYYGATGQVDTIDDFIFNEPLVLLGEDGAPFLNPFTPKAYLIDGPSWVNNHAHVLRARDELDRRFLKHWLDVFDYSGYVSGTTRLKLTQSAMREMIVPVPPIAEQSAIVAKIERMLSHLDAAETYRCSAASRIPVATTAVLRQLAGRDSADLHPLEYLAEILDSRRIPVNASQRAKRPGEVPYFGATGQVGTIDEALFNEPLVLLGEDGVKFNSLTARKAYSIQGPAWVNNHAHVLRPKPVVRQGWLEAALNAADYDGLYSGTTRLKLNQGQMKKLQVPVPSLKVQDALLQQLDAAQSLLSHTKTVTDRFTDRSAVLRRSILNAAFEGRLSSSPASARSAEEVA